MNYAYGTLDTKADVECSKLMSAEGKHMKVVAKVAEIQPKTIEKRRSALQNLFRQV